MISRRPPAPLGLRPARGSARKQSAVLGLRIATQLFLIILVPCTAMAQSSLFDYWAVDFLSTSWGPIRTDSMGAWVAGIPAPHPHRFVFGVEGQALSVGKTARLSRHRITARMRQPLPGTAHTFVMGVTHEARTISATSGERYMQTGSVRTVDLGLELWRRRTIAGDWAVIGATSWNSAISWLAELRGESRFHLLRVSRWKSNPHPIRFSLPTETATDIAEEHQVGGTMLSVAVAIPLPSALRLGAGAKRETGDVRQESIDGSSFLTVSPAGTMRNRDIWLSLSRDSSRGVVVHRRERTADLEGAFQREELAAGRLFFGQWNFSRWMVTGWLGTGSHDWRLSFARDEMQSDLSARLETWPFVALWEQLGAIAFRYRVGLDGHSLWARFTRANRGGAAGFGWSTTITRYEVQANQEDWLVTSLGFGRAEQEATRWDIESLVTLGLELARAFNTRTGMLTISAAVEVPVYARSVQTPEPAETARGLSGQLKAGASWAW